MLQATASALRLVAMEGMALLHEWRAPDGHQISMACVDAEHVLLATTGKQLHLFVLQVHTHAVSIHMPCTYTCCAHAVHGMHLLLATYYTHYRWARRRGP